MFNRESHIENLYISKFLYSVFQIKVLSMSDKEEEKNLTFFQMVGSVLASFFGVQTAENRERDFKHGKAKVFIAVAILMTIVWYGIIAIIVHFVV